MRNTAAKLTLIRLKVNVKFTRPKPKVNVQLCWISGFSRSSWIETTASGLSYELGVNGTKRVHGNWDIINENEHNTFHTGKHESQCQKNLWLLTSFIQMIFIGHVLEAPGPYQ